MDNRDLLRKIGSAALAEYGMVVPIEVCIRVGRAAVLAMREPTPSMLERSHDEDDPGFCDEPGDPTDAETHWRLMIDDLAAAPGTTP